MSDFEKAMEGHKLFEYLGGHDPIFMKKPPSKPIREIKVTPIKTKKNYNYLMMYWVVSYYRQREYRIVKMQDNRELKLSKHPQYLVDKMFKNW